jgi:hypothetical protein
MKITNDKEIDVLLSTDFSELIDGDTVYLQQGMMCLDSCFFADIETDESYIRIDVYKNLNEQAEFHNYSAVKDAMIEQKDYENIDVIFFHIRADHEEEDKQAYYNEIAKLYAKYSTIY